MEHRYSERKPITLEVMVDYRSLGLVRGRTTDISLGGMFLDTGQIRLPVHAPVGLTFRVNDDGEWVACRAHAVVVHRNNQGVGLMFDGVDETTHRLLRRLAGDWQSSGMGSGDAGRIAQA